ncbi:MULTISPECIES: hypothetical protein [Pantoea]|uniref:hypothetical protein n=1 Tax=Pantoea TaxID=53335 RepID=UPI001E537370|nr:MULTISPECIES: hypothetical protein [Pantoea]UYV59462.1 hypothetical protein OH655_20880 [Pantoea dispersa]
MPADPGDQVKQDVDKKKASGLEGTIKDLGDALDKATQCSFGRACSSENGQEQNQANIGKDLSDADKPNWVERGPERLAIGSHRMRKMHGIMRLIVL